MKILINMLSLFFCLTIGLQAQTFASRKLKEISELFPKTCLPTTDSIFNCPQITKGKSFIVRYNQKNEIEHLGVSLFSPETKEMINAQVCNFIERIMLELLLQKSVGDVQSKLLEYKINLQKNGLDYGKISFRSLSDVLNKIQYPTQFVLHRDSIYTAIWKYSITESLSMSFPVSRELIFGTNKKESDTGINELFGNDICTDSISAKALVTVSVSDVTPIEGTDLYRHKGDIFMISQINADTWYQRSDTLYHLLFNPAYPRESLANLFITKQIENSLQLNITHRMYGGFTPEFTIPLNRFFCLFDKGFSFYVLLYPLGDSKNIRISVILYNHNYNYIHLLRVQTTSDHLFNEKGVMTADFYTNIPLHNLINLFK